MAWVNIIELIYPVDAVYTSTNIENSPADLFGGTWSLIGKTTTTATTQANDGYDSSATTTYHWVRTA